MTANFGKFIDRSPIICPAGKKTDNSGNSVANTFQEYSVVDKVTALKHDAKIWSEDQFIAPKNLPSIQNAAHRGIYSEIREILCPPVETRFQTLINDLKETTYSSYWNKELGKVRDNVPGLPKGMNPYTFTCGRPSTREYSVKEVLNPPLTPYEVLWNSQIGHEHYKKTHNDYNPSEQVSRGYKSPSFNPDKRYGQQTKYDHRGIWVRCACDWHKNEPIVYASKIQADHFEKRRPLLGKSLTPNRNIECVPKDHRFGKPLVESRYGVAELLKDPDCPQCHLKRDFFKWLTFLNRLRNKLKAKSGGDFNFDDFCLRLQYYDQEKTDFVPLDTFYELCSCYGIRFSRGDIESLLKILNIISGDKINYKKFIQIANVNNSYELISVKDIPKEHLFYATTQQALGCDYLIINNADMPVAGLPSIRHDLKINIVPPKGCKADLSHLGDETTVKGLINPCIYTHYGLNYKDFFTPRSAAIVKALFEKTGHNFPGDSFDEIWKIGMEEDQTGDKVCIQTFKNLVNYFFPPRQVAVDENDQV